MEKNKKQTNTVLRPPVVVVMGHIDHGKSTLLDYIRKTNVVAQEAGSITQHLSAYEVTHKDERGQERKITFLDTPGHEAFSTIRERGAKAADIAILLVSAEDGVKPQTVEAWKTIQVSKIPTIVAINKIDKPGANVEKTKQELAENEVFLENYGGQIPYALISAKTGEGIDGLLSLLLILAEVENLTGNPEESASGFVLEAALDPRRGIQATLVIKNGSLKKGMVTVSGNSFCAARIFENFKGETITEAGFSSPVRLAPWNEMPKAGNSFQSFKNKRAAEEYLRTEPNYSTLPETRSLNPMEKKILPVVLKADVSGSLEAIEKEIAKITDDQAEFKIVVRGTGPISESDLKTVARGEETLIVGFNVKADKGAREMAENRGISIFFFDVIYKLTEWLKAEMALRRPKIATEETVGRAKILKVFSRTRERQVVGGKVIEGSIGVGKTVKIMRRDFEIGKGKIVNLQKNKDKVSAVETDSEFGMLLESKTEIVPGDFLESFAVTQK